LADGTIHTSVFSRERVPGYKWLHSVPTPTSFPAIYGSEALLKVLSDEGEQSVYLLAIDGADRPWVMKMLPPQGEAALELDALGTEIRWLRRMQSANLARVLSSEGVDGMRGVVMEHVPGKSLAAIRSRAEQLSDLPPPELGVVVAHDVFAALELFHEFEGAGRVHGNVSSRTILVGYSGEAKIAGYRLGCHPRAAADGLFSRDLKPLADILCDMPFHRFPQALAHLVPRLLEETISPTEAIAATKSFVRDCVPSVDDRRTVAAWLEKVFPGERDREAREDQQLLAEGIKLIVKSKADKRGWARNPVAGDEIGEYRIIGVLGEGGMGRVYEAEHLKTGGHVALKVLHPRGRTRAIEERFRREAESILRISNPHVVDIERFGPSADGKFLYLAMELLSGESLDRVLFNSEPFEPLRALEIASQICQALAAAHEAGVIHRDLKPGNVMLVKRDGNADFVKILDFGLARLDVGEAALTRVGDLIGTFAYMAPEQGQGKPATPKIDIYAVGELLYEMLTKKLPHEGEEEILVRKATVDAMPIAERRPDLPDDICQVVMKALARDPESRYTTMADLGQEIDFIIAQLTERPSIFQRRWVKAVAGGIAASLVLAVGVAWLIGNRRGRTVSESVPREIEPVHTATLPVPSTQPVPAPSTADVAAPTQLPAPEKHPRQKPAIQEIHPAKRNPEESSTEQLLRAADAAFDSGNRREAIILGTQALNAGSGVRAHLALGEYYRSARLYQEALRHYRAALKMDPTNHPAMKGIDMVAADRDRRKE
jgi:serine/threonine protein kinase